MEYKQNDKSKKIELYPIQLKLCRRIRDLRQDHDLTQKDVAKILNVARSTYSYYEIGRSHPDYGMLVKLAELYGVSTDYLLGKE